MIKIFWSLRIFIYERPNIRTRGPFQNRWTQIYITSFVVTTEPCEDPLKWPSSLQHATTSLPRFCHHMCQKWKWRWGTNPKCIYILDMNIRSSIDHERGRKLLLSMHHHHHHHHGREPVGTCRPSIVWLFDHSSHKHQNEEQASSLFHIIVHRHHQYRTSTPGNWYWFDR